MEFEVFKRCVLGPAVFLALSNGFCGGRDKRGAPSRKRQGPMAKKCCYNKNLMTLFWGEKREEREENDPTWIIFSQNVVFLAFVKNNQHVHFSAHGHSSCSTFGLRLVRGPEAL